jgi:hypothetical protein
MTMSHFDSKTWAPIQEADGVSVCHPSIVSYAGKVLTVAWQGNVADTNRLMRQLCAFPELAAALKEVRDCLEQCHVTHQPGTMARKAHSAAINALAKLEG